MKSFEERLNRYKKETDYFAVDIWKSEDCVWETKHDLTWQEARAILNRAKKNNKIYRVDIVVEDWDADDDYLFKEVESLEKKAFQWRLHLDDFSMTPTGWKCKE